MVTLDQGQRPQVMCTKGNAPRSNRQKSIVEMTFGPNLLIYTPPQKKGNFRKVAFLLGKSVESLTFMPETQVQFQD